MLLERLASARGPIAYGRGWDQEVLEEGRPPTRAELDRAVPDRPAVAVRICGHMAVANTLALRIARPWEAYPGLVDPDGGMLLEDAVYYTLERLLGSLNITGLVEEAARRLYSVGVRGASSMACNTKEVEALERLSLSGRLPLRVSCYVESSLLDKVGPVSLGRRAAIVGVKLFSDGSLGARTAYLREPYSDDPGNRGRLLLDSRMIERLASMALGKGLRVAVHAIGDAALDEVLEAYNRLQPGGMARVEHASIARNSQIEMLAELDVWTVVQPRFRVSDWWIEKRLGPRAHLAYRFRTMLRGGVKLALSTDSPVEPYDPVETFVAAVRCAECRSGENLEPREALYLYTEASALASGGPAGLLGRLEAGAPAELSWTPEDPRRKEWRGPFRSLEL